MKALHDGLLADLSPLCRRALADGNIPLNQKWQSAGGARFACLLALTPQGEQLVYYMPEVRRSVVGDTSTIQVHRIGR